MRTPEGVGKSCLSEEPATGSSVRGGETECLTGLLLSSDQRPGRSGFSTAGRTSSRWLLAAVVCGCVLAGPSPASRAPVCAADGYRHGVVAADHPLASEAGVEILRRGGNVVDAAVATAFALSVVRPASSGLGGGGFMLIWDARRHRAVAIDYRERAPLRATRNLFSSRDDPLASQVGGLSVAVPGQVAGLCYTLEHFGTLDLQTVLQPAIRLAERGFAADRETVASQRSALKRLAPVPDGRQRFGELLRQYFGPNGQTLQPGQRWKSPQLAVLQRLARLGARGFYEGPVAEDIVRTVAAAGGILTHEDLRQMKPVQRSPVVCQWRGCTVFGMPPPSSGGVALAEMLNTLGQWESRFPDRPLEQLGWLTADAVHLQVELMKHAFADRARFLGDADLVDVPVDRLTSPRYAQQLAARLSLERTGPPPEYGAAAVPDDGGTSHFCVLDAEGNAVACTETINASYGSLLVTPRFGIVLNNEMDDFATRPGQPNLYGLVQSEANAVEPGKRPLSSMSPTIVVANGRAVHVAGASGGPRIISTTFQVLLSLVVYGKSPQEAVAAPRFHHQWLPNELWLEPALFGRLAEPLRRKGHVVTQRSRFSACQAASRTDDGLQGASDPRKHGRPAGW